MGKKKIDFILPLILFWTAAVLMFHSAVFICADELPENVLFEVNNSAGGEPIGPYYDFEDGSGTRYLFLPSHAEENLTIHYAGDIVSVSAGSLDTESRTISGNMSDLTVTFSNGSEASLIIMRSKIPSLEISLEDTLDDVHADKDKISMNASCVLIDPKDPSNNFVQAGDCEFKGRGNSSWEVYDKKGYQLRLEEPRMVLGMERARTWVLLANASDPTLLRNKIVYDIAKQMDLAYAPEGEFVDLWVNGEYRGLYLLTEKVQIGPSRLDLVSGHGIIAEYDNAFYNTEVFFRDYFGNYFTLKDSSDPEGLGDFLKFQEAVDTLDYLLDQKRDWGEIEKRIDAASFARMFLLNEYFANCESAVTSFFWYRDGDEDVLHAGPAWDYDTCMRDGVEDPAEYYVYQNTFYNHFLRYPEFQQLMTDIYAEECRSLFDGAAGDMSLLRSILTSSIDMNYVRWNVLGETDAKGHASLPSYELNFNNQRSWLSDRAQAFSPEGVISCVVPYVISLEKSADGKYIDFYLTSTRLAVASVEVAVWSRAGGTATTSWIRADRETAQTGTSAGSKWHAQFDLESARYLGTYDVQMVVNGQRSQPVGESTFFIGDLPTDTVQYTYEGIDFSPVFDPVYYAMRYPIVRKQVGYDREKLFSHFISTGIKAGYQGSASFDVLWYRENNEDLAAIYKDSYLSYYEHYLLKGMPEGRPGHP